MPMVARGKKAPLSGSRLLFASTQSYWDKYTMHSETDGELTFDVAVVRRYSRPSRSGTKRLPPTTLVYAVVGKRLRCQVCRRSLYSVVETYRQRFGIESSYRQMNQARLRTSSGSPELRLLAVAIAFLLRNRKDVVSMDDVGSFLAWSSLRRQRVLLPYSAALD